MRRGSNKEPPNPRIPAMKALNRINQSGLARMEEAMRQGLAHVFPAAVLFVAHSGDVVFHRAYGSLDPETRQRPTRLDSLFDLASVTKLFTVTAFMRLVEAGRAELDAPVIGVIPEFGGIRPIGPVEDPLTKEPLPADAAYQGQTVDADRITFRHLLTHTSGLAAWRAIYAVALAGEDLSIEGRQRRGIAAICSYDFAYPAGARVVYSDLGLILLGEAVGRLAEARLDQAIQDLVLSPLGLRDTTFNPPPEIHERVAPTEVCAWRGRRLRGEVHDENAAGLGGVAGHAGLFGTAADVAALGCCYLDGGAYAGTRLLSPETVAEMTWEQAVDGDIRRGLGWMLRSPVGASCGEHFSSDSYGHTGFTGTSLWVDPRMQLVVVLLTNRVYYGRDPEGIQHFRPRLHDAVVEALDG